MSRLIYADKLKYELFADNYNAKMTPQQVADCIDNQPTAYNTDKVVAELEGRSRSMVPVIPTHEAIDIVKRGGVE